jgi:hypothetical protein
MKMNRPHEITAGRPLTSSEISLIEWLLACARTINGSVLTSWEKYRAQNGCDCGCGSLDLLVQKVSTDEGTHRIIASAAGTTPDGAHVIVFLHAESEIITELEIMCIDANRPSSTPCPEHLAPFLTRANK